MHLKNKKYRKFQARFLRVFFIYFVMCHILFNTLKIGVINKEDFMANFLPLASTMYYVSKKHKRSGSSGSNKKEDDKGIDKKLAGIIAIAVGPFAVLTITLPVAVYFGAMAPYDAFTLIMLSMCGWTMIVFMQVLMFCMTALDCDAAPLITIFVMDAAIVVVEFTTKITQILPFLAAILAFFAVQLVLAELSAGSVSWLVKKIRREKKEK